MEIEVECENCGRQLSVETDCSQYDEIKCWGCGTKTFYVDFIRNNLSKVNKCNGFDIECGTLVEYHGFSSTPILPPEIAIIQGGVRDDGTHIFKRIYEDDLRKGVFEDSDITGITFTTSVREIGDYAFANCKNLMHLILPEGLEKIGTGAFEGCTSLIQVQIPITCTKIGLGAFKNCSSLSKVVILEKKEQYLQDNVPWTCGERYYSDELSQIRKVHRYGEIEDEYVPEIPDRERLEVGDCAFQFCENLWSVNLPKAGTIPARCFEGCKSLDEFSISERAYEIASYAFRNCSALRHVDIPKKMSFIKPYAFDGCDNIKALKFPLQNDVPEKDRKLYLDINCFSGMPSLTSINIPDYATIYKGTFEGCPNLRNIEISDEKLLTWYGVMKHLPGINRKASLIIDKLSPKKQKMNSIKKEITQILQDISNAYDRYNQLGTFDIREKSSLNSRIKELSRKKDELFSIGESLDKETENELRTICNTWRGRESLASPTGACYPGPSFSEYRDPTVENAEPGKYYSFFDWRYRRY